MIEDFFDKGPVVPAVGVVLYLAFSDAGSVAIRIRSIRLAALFLMCADHVLPLLVLVLHFLLLKFRVLLLFDLVPFGVKSVFSGLVSSGL